MDTTMLFPLISVSGVGSSPDGRNGVWGLERGRCDTDQSWGVRLHCFMTASDSLI